MLTAGTEECIVVQQDIAISKVVSRVRTAVSQTTVIGTKHPHQNVICVLLMLNAMLEKAVT